MLIRANQQVLHQDQVALVRLLLVHTHHHLVDPKGLRYCRWALSRKRFFQVLKVAGAHVFKHFDFVAFDRFQHVLLVSGHEEGAAGFAARIVRPLLALTQALNEVLMPAAVNFPERFKVARHVQGHSTVEPRMEKVVNFSFSL